MPTAGRCGGGASQRSLALAAASLLVLLLALAAPTFAQTSPNATNKKKGGSIAHCVAYSTAPPNVGASHKKGNATAKYCAQCAVGYAVNPSGLSCGECFLVVVVVK